MESILGLWNRGLDQCGTIKSTGTLETHTQNLVYNYEWNLPFLECWCNKSNFLVLILSRVAILWGNIHTVALATMGTPNFELFQYIWISICRRHTLWALIKLKYPSNKFFIWFSVMMDFKNFWSNLMQKERKKSVSRFLM